MIEIQLFSLILGLAIIFIFIGWTRKQYVLSMIGSLFFVYAGLLTFSGFRYVSGKVLNATITAVNTTITTETIQFSSWSSNLANPLSITLILVGVFLLVVSILGIIGTKPEREHSDEESM